LNFAGDDAAFCLAITEFARVAAIPLSAFYDGNAPTSFVRFAFCKQEGTLHEAISRLGYWLNPASQKLTATA
jgi:aspartate/methionine/tyrosine aminotransferase